MTKQTKAAPLPSFADPVEWVEEWIPVDEVIRSKNLQMRKKLTTSAITQYKKRTEAGSTPPPIKVAKVTEKGQTRLFLVDGWHRWEANALTFNEANVLAEVAPMSMNEAVLQAAAANLNHGERFKQCEMEAVFKAFVRAGRHRTAKGYRSYREMAEVTGVSKSTLQRWMQKHFRAIALRMGGTNSKAPGGLREVAPAPTLVGEVLSEVERIKGIALSLPQPERDDVLRGLHALLDALSKPAPAPRYEVEHDEF